MKNFLIVLELMKKFSDTRNVDYQKSTIQRANKNIISEMAVNSTQSTFQNASVRDVSS